MFGFKYDVELSTRPENSMGSDEDWEAATRRPEAGPGASWAWPTSINEGDGAFYGPKIDFHLARQPRTYLAVRHHPARLPAAAERFELEYVGEDGEKQRPIMIHRVCFGSIERFIGILTEHFARQVPDVARADAGQGSAGFRQEHGLCEGGLRSAARKDDPLRAG